MTLKTNTLFVRRIFQQQIQVILQLTQKTSTPTQSESHKYKEKACVKPTDRCVPSVAFYAGHVSSRPRPYLLVSRKVYYITSLSSPCTCSSPRLDPERPPCSCRRHTGEKLRARLLFFYISSSSLSPPSPSSLTSQPLCPFPGRTVLDYYARAQHEGICRHPFLQQWGCCKSWPEFDYHMSVVL